MSRLVFRGKCDGVAWQKQMRDKYISEGIPDVPHLDVKKAIVRPVTRNLAKQIILKYEWLGTLVPAQLYYGIFFGNYCAGVTCVSLGGGGANVYAHKEWGVTPQELAYLNRGANVHWSPKGANSKLVSWTCRFLKRDTAAKIVIAYADTDAGEYGTIYQACNWICVGKGSSTEQWVAPNGRVYDQKLPWNLARAKGGTRKNWVLALKKAGWRTQLSNPKYRYVYILDKNDKRLCELVEKKRVPYPKRPGQE